jgi:hypothetical protein
MRTTIICGALLALTVTTAGAADFARLYDGRRRWCAWMSRISQCNGHRAATRRSRMVRPLSIFKALRHDHITGLHCCARILHWIPNFVTTAPRKGMRKTEKTMLRDCRFCGAVGLTMCVCLVGGEVARSIKEREPEEAKVRLYVTYRGGGDQPHSHDEPTPPTPNGAVLIRASSTAFMGVQNSWAVIPSSIAPPPPTLLWWAPPWPRSSS